MREIMRTTVSVVRPWVLVSPRRQSALVCVLVLWSNLAAAGFADRPAACGSCEISSACVSLPRQQDEVWLVSSRGLGCGELGNSGQQLAYWRNEPSHGWAVSSHAAWLAGDPSVPVSIFVHGNDMTFQRSVEEGWAVYGDLVRSAPEQPPMRFVIYSWPADKIRGLPANNVRAKCARCDVDARYMAWFIDQLEPQTPLSLGGYSVGARIVGGALQLTAGGSLNGRPMLAQTHPKREPVRVLLMAAAMDSDWFLPGRRYGLAIGQMKHLTLLNNTCDRALRFYHRIYCKHGGPEALGYTGFPGPQLLGDGHGKLEEYDVCCFIGPEHNWEHYTGTASVANLIGRGLYADPLPREHQPGAADSASKPADSSATEVLPAGNVTK
jgi:hypothetical protein